ncbi:MAG: hypothetical protein Kow0037_07030 [Calditrichia bacterium]
MTRANIQQTPYFQLPRILFLFTAQVFTGTFILHFLVVYFTFKENLFRQRLADFTNYIPYYIAGTLLVAFLYFIGLKKNNYFDLEKSARNHPPDFHPVMALLASGLLLLIANFFSGIKHFGYVFAAAGMIYALFQLSRIYTFNYSRPSWQHPTTAGAVIFGAFLSGLSICLLLIGEWEVLSLLGKLIFATLIFQTLIVWSRFRYLSSANAVTYQTVKMMLGNYLLLFAVRFVFGLAMPAVYVFWMVFVSPLPSHPAVLMIIVGEISERILFFLTAEAYFGEIHSGEETLNSQEN